MPKPQWLDRPTTARVGGDWFHVVKSPADPWIELMENETRFQRRAVLATIALQHDPGCIEALLFLARHAKQNHVAASHLRKAVQSGAALWAQVAADQDDFAWWGVTATRPFMRAIADYADWYADRRDEASARRLYRELMEMNPDDNQGIRYKLAELEAAAPTPAR